jgi:hypothetical protein
LEAELLAAAFPCKVNPIPRTPVPTCSSTAIVETAASILCIGRYYYGNLFKTFWYTLSQIVGFQIQVSPISTRREDVFLGVMIYKVKADMDDNMAQIFTSLDDLKTKFEL